MSSTSQPSIFPKSNLIYIPLSITIAHTINFMVNSPLSIWQEFPPKLPDSVYISVFLTPFLLFISLTFEPIQTRKRFYILLSLAFIFVSIPLSYRKYPSALNNSFALTAAQYLLKMLLFLKFNRVYSNQKNSDQKKEFKSFLWSLFNWRFDSYIIPPQSKNSNEKENPLIIKSPTTSQINQKLISRLMLILAKWTIYELSLFISIKYMMEVPEEAYQIRLMKFVTKGTLPLTMTLMIECLSCTVLTYITLSLYYDAFTFIVTIIFRVFYSASEKNIHQNILIRLGVLTPSEYISLSEWIISFLFNTKHVFSEPWMSSSPRDFWSVRWQLLIKESLQELGYLPVKNLFISIVPKKVANMMGVLGAFLVSALLHEYIIIAQSDVWTGEHTFFFMMHGVVMILWEIVFGNENKNKNTKVQRFLKWVLLIVINLLLIPAFVEPIKIHCYLPSYFAHSNCKRI